MSHQRKIYLSENGDIWWLCRDEDGRAFVLHEANRPSGGQVTQMEIGDFLRPGRAGPEQQALIRLIGQLATLGDADTTPPVTAREGGGSS
jgi:hypothetical protein